MCLIIYIPLQLFAHNHNRVVVIAFRVKKPTTTTISDEVCGLSLQYTLENSQQKNLVQRTLKKNVLPFIQELDKLLFVSLSQRPHSKSRFRGAAAAATKCSKTLKIPLEK